MAKMQGIDNISVFRKCAVVVAHPDDETLWAGGTMLMHPECDWRIVTLCRKSDSDRSVKFHKVCKELGADGLMADMDDGPEQKPLDMTEVEETIINLLDDESFDLVITHSLNGEYTRHLRHEETAKAVVSLWSRGVLKTKCLWMFAYEDGGRAYLPRAIEKTDLYIELPSKIRQRKYDIITELYGFSTDSFEAKTSPGREAYWCCSSADDVKQKFNWKGNKK